MGDKMRYVPPADDVCPVCFHLVSEPAGFHCQVRHKKPYVWPWEG